MPVIETWYKEICFRSRLEARWAVFLDVLHIPWEYEKEGYEFREGIMYLPDFWLPEQELWVEIKGEDPTEIELKKAFLLAEETNFDVVILSGQIPQPLAFGVPTEWSRIFAPDGIDYGYGWSQCPDCGEIGLTFGGWAHRLPCECYNEERRCKAPPTENIDKALTAARSSRFEHGQIGAII